MAATPSGFAHPSHSQKNCPFFTKIPKEIRDQIFDLALSPYKKLQISCSCYSHCGRPDFGHLDGKLSTALVRTSQRIYDEICHLPARNYIGVDFGHHGHGSHRLNDHSSAGSSFSSKTQKLHLFIDDWGFVGPKTNTSSMNWPTYTELVAKKAPNLRFLKLTIGKYDCSWWDAKLILMNAGECRVNTPEGPFSNAFWEYQLQAFPNLKSLELEIQTIEADMKNFDSKADSVVGWRIRLASGTEIALKPKRIKREGWYGQAEVFWFWHSQQTGREGSTYGTMEPAPCLDLVLAKERLVNAGVDFIGDTHPTGADKLTFYALTFVFEVTKAYKILL